MKLTFSLVVLSCLSQVLGYPYYPYYGTNMESLSFGASDSSRGGMALNRYYNPYYNQRGLGGGMAAFMFRPSEEQPHSPHQQYYQPERRRQTLPEVNLLPPQQNEVYPQTPERPIPTGAPEIADPTEKTEVIPTTLKTVNPELTEEVEDVPEPEKPKKRVSKKKQVKKPVEEEAGSEEEDALPKMPGGTFFPMFFGWGGRSAGGGTPGGATAVANAYSTGRGGVANSHATAFGPPRPDYKYQA